MQEEFKFNVYGKFISIRAGGSRWQAFFLGYEGKRRLADFVIPDFIEPEELATFLGDLFHEMATPQNSEVVRII